MTDDLNCADCGRPEYNPIHPLTDVDGAVFVVLEHHAPGAHPFRKAGPTDAAALDWLARMGRYLPAHMTGAAFHAGTVWQREQDEGQLAAAAEEEHRWIAAHDELIEQLRVVRAGQDGLQADRDALEARLAETHITRFRTELWKVALAALLVVEGLARWARRR